MMRQGAESPPSRRQAVLVLGMHRSGTSALAGTLARLGVQAPLSLIEPTRNNPKGYFESTVLMRFHDEVLASAGTAWSDWDRFDPAWMDSEVAGDFIARLPAILEEEYGDGRLLLVKDPRICRLLPLWLRVLAKLDIAPKIVLPVRHPGEVAESLEARNDFGRQRAGLIWLRHVLDAEFHSRGCARVVVRYADVLADWRGVADRMASGLSIDWPDRSPAVEADIDGFLSGGLRHHAIEDGAAADGPGIAGWIAQAHAALQQLAEPDGAHDAAMAALDGVRGEFDASSALYATVAREGDAKAQARIKELGELKKRSDALRAELAECAARHASQVAATAKSAAIASGLRRELAGERAARARQTLDDHAMAAGLERELALHRQLAVDRLHELRRMQEGRLAKAVASLQRLARRRAPEPEVPALPDDETIRRSGLFDPEWYLRRYPDVRRNGGDPLAHYLRYGAGEGRDPGPAFSTRDYLRRYPDVSESGINPLVHYVRHGIGEGRRARDA